MERSCFYFRERDCETIRHDDKCRPGELERAALINAIPMKDDEDDKNRVLSTTCTAVVMLHSLQTESMNGRVGTIVEYSYVPHSDRFAVKLEGSGKEVAIRACNFSLVNHNVTTQHTSSTGATHQQAGTTEITTSTSSEQQRQRELETALLHPGALFVGTIQIPGLSEDEGRKEYSMTVVLTRFKTKWDSQRGF